VGGGSFDLLGLGGCGVSRNHTCVIEPKEADGHDNGLNENNDLRKEKPT